MTGASGTDFSQQAAAQIAYTDLVIDGAINTNFMSAANPITAAHVGNIVNITGGTGFTVQRVQIVSQAAGVATCDKSLGTLGSTGGTGNLGGALALPATAVAAMVGQNIVWVGAGTYLQTAAIVPPVGASGGLATRLIGYNVTRGDLDSATVFTNHPVLQMNNATANILATTNNYTDTANFVFDGGVGASKPVNCVQGSSNVHVIRNCRATRSTDFGFRQESASLTLIRCEVTALIAGARAGFYLGGGGSSAYWCVAIANPCSGFWVTGAESDLVGCMSVANTGASSDGIQAGTSGITLIGSVLYGNGRDGIRQTASAGFSGLTLQNSIISGNGGYGINAASQAITRTLGADYNAFYNNTSGARNNFPAGDHDVTLTADPFTNAAGNDFSLNNVAGGGAACRNVGFPGALPGLATPLGYADIGVYRHQDPTAGGGLRLAGHGGLAA